MDELKISGKFMRAITSKLISRMISKKFGYKIDIQINEIEIRVVDEKANVHVNADAEINTNELKKFVRILGINEES